MKVETVILHGDGVGPKEFRIDHATKLYKFEGEKLKKRNWHLPENSPHTFENGIFVKRSGNRRNQKSEEPKGNPEGEADKDTL